MFKSACDEVMQPNFQLSFSYSLSQCDQESNWASLSPSSSSHSFPSHDSFDIHGRALPSLAPADSVGTVRVTRSMSKARLQKAQHYVDHGGQSQTFTREIPIPEIRALDEENGTPSQDFWSK